MSADEAFWLLRLMSKCTHHFPEIPLSFPPFIHLHPTTHFSSRLRGPAHRITPSQIVPLSFSPFQTCLLLISVD